MLAQGQPSSAKRGGLAADVSSGLIFLKKKNKKKTHSGDSSVLGSVRAAGLLGLSSVALIPFLYGGLEEHGHHYEFLFMNSLMSFAMFVTTC